MRVMTDQDIEYCERDMLALPELHRELQHLRPGPGSVRQGARR